MANSVLKDIYGPDWPLGFIAVPTPGTPVGIMSLVEPTSVNDPSTASTSAALEYTPSVQQLIFLAVKPGASHGTQSNTGNIYIVRYAARGAGAGNRDDTGTMIFALGPGQNLFLSSAPLNRNVWSPYRYYIDADNANDGALVTLVIQ